MGTGVVEAAQEPVWAQRIQSEGVVERLLKGDAGGTVNRRCLSPPSPPWSGSHQLQGPQQRRIFGAAQGALRSRFHQPRQRPRLGSTSCSSRSRAAASFSARSITVKPPEVAQPRKDDRQNHLAEKTGASGEQNRRIAKSLFCPPCTRPNGSPITPASLIVARARHLPQPLFARPRSPKDLCRTGSRGPSTPPGARPAR